MYGSLWDRNVFLYLFIFWITLVGQKRFPYLTIVLMGVALGGLFIGVLAYAIIGCSRFKEHYFTQKLPPYEEFDVTVALAVIMNSKLAEGRVSSAPGVVVGYPGPLTEEIEAALWKVALGGEHYSGPEGDVPKEALALRAMLRDDTYVHNRRREVPFDIANIRGLFLYDVILHAAHWNNLLGGIEIPVAIARGSNGSIIHLPHDLVEWEPEQEAANIVRHEVLSEEPDTTLLTSFSGEISRHVEANIGKVTSVFREIVPDAIPIDIMIVPPSETRRWFTLVTSGGSSLPMSAPKGAEDLRRCELAIRVPAQPGQAPNATEPPFNWVYFWMRRLARFPHEFKSFIAAEQTICGSEPPTPMSDGVPFAGWLFAHFHSNDESLPPLKCSNGEQIHFYSLVPLHASELDYKIREGTDALLALLAKAGVTDLLSAGRQPLISIPM